MKKLILVLLMTSAVSCTKTNPPLEQVEAPLTSAEKAEAMPTLHLEVADRACMKDGDCETIPTQCSCGCGEGLNKANTAKYAGKLQEICQNYDGKICKVMCSGETKCIEKICTRVD